jgi:aryl-alcohol dehydrogenase-like predicted oxidoreductase
VSAAIIGASNTEQLNEVIGASGWRLSDEAIAELDEVSKA